MLMSLLKTHIYSFLQIHTDGSKRIETGRTGTAFYVPEFKVNWKSEEAEETEEAWKDNSIYS